jgi:5-methylcytosine-specific restriction endonuclease McrA
VREENMSEDDQKIVLRTQAILDGLVHYFTGKPCHKGHVAKRYVKTGHCVDCTTDRNRSEKKVEYRKQYKQRNYSKILLKNKMLYSANPDKYRKYNREYQKKHVETLRPKNAFRAMQRIAAKLQRTPLWLTEDHKWMVSEIYDLAAKRTKATGTKWEVDHVVPLRGSCVSGLHVPWNLQVILMAQNRSKGNTFNYQAIA